jgi:hypothetical protein
VPILVRRSPHSPCWRNPPANIRPNSSIIHDWWASWMSVGIIRICNTSSTELYCVLMLVLLVELEPAPGALTTRILPTRNILYRFIFVKGFDDYRPSCWINSFIRSVYVSRVLSVYLSRRLRRQRDLPRDHYGGGTSKTRKRYLTNPTFLNSYCNATTL